ncbi:BadF/BadG/BcrA/BcrD ATPase family protein [Ruegeria sp. EL01]|jgi:glucosamine kinase|uniref:BadF/BadG/BcrA/BcrD ATPase family protein n=1 Tax=Ruegeria sp. EL01 TaxID=2107578 RepID=UPI000EA80B14|nr:BadF/BadG/BcrA/BcrD ATPase family protein [Ruegeria sp. EL01]
MVESFPYLIAIDGGGTRCRFAMTTPAGLLQVTLGSANVFSNRESAIQTLEAGLTKLMDLAGLPQTALADIPVYAGLAGVTDSQVASEVASRLPSRVAEVEDDRRSAVVGALGSQNGCLIGVGTGSFLARQLDGQIRFIGGYGPVIGDEASGHWLGKQLLRSVLLAMDGIQPHSPLTQDISTRFGDDPAQIVAFSGAARPAEIADFTPDIISAAKAGDLTAQGLMQKGAGYLSDGLRALGHSDGDPICAVGGVAACYQDYLPTEMAAALTEPDGTAIDGALQLARRLAERAKVGAV